jgi:hypothetical protein
VTGGCLSLVLGGGYGQEVRCVVIDIQNVYNKIIYCVVSVCEVSFRALFGVGIMIESIDCARPSLRLQYVPECEIADWPWPQSRVVMLNPAESQRGDCRKPVDGKMAVRN